MALEMKCETRIAAPAERVLAAMLDVDSYQHWMPNFVAAERLDEGEMGVGSRWRETRKMFGREATEVFQVKALEPPRRVSLFCDGRDGTSKKGEYHFDYELRPDGEHTVLTMDGRIVIPGWVAGVMGRLFGRSFKKALVKDMEALRKHIESQG